MKELYLLAAPENTEGILGRALPLGTWGSGKDADLGVGGRCLWIKMDSPVSLSVEKGRGLD